MSGLGWRETPKDSAVSQGEKSRTVISARPEGMRGGKGYQTRREPCRDSSLKGAVTFSLGSSKPKASQQGERSWKGDQKHRDLPLLSSPKPPARTQHWLIPISGQRVRRPTEERGMDAVHTGQLPRAGEWGRESPWRGKQKIAKGPGEALPLQ